jgi:hypothetical protein
MLGWYGAGRVLTGSRTVCSFGSEPLDKIVCVRTILPESSTSFNGWGSWPRGHDAVPTGEHVENVFDANSHPANARTAATLTRVRGDPI